MKPTVARILPAALLLLVGCDLLATRYEPASLAHALKGMVPSAADSYRIPMPHFAAATKNTAIARDGSIFAIVVGPDLREIVQSYPSEETELGVRLVKADRRYLVVEKVFTNDGGIDLFEGIEKFRFRRPNLVAHTEIPHEKFDHELGLCEVPPHSRTLDSVAEKKVYLSEFKVEKHEVPATLLASASEVDATKPQPPVQYFLTSDGSDYLVTTEDPMTRLMLEFLIAEQREFRGGVRVSDVFPRSVRTETKVAGRVEVKWISLGGALYYRPT